MAVNARNKKKNYEIIDHESLIPKLTTSLLIFFFQYVFHYELFSHQLIRKWYANIGTCSSYENNKVQFTNANNEFNPTVGFLIGYWNRTDFLLTIIQEI